MRVDLCLGHNGPVPSDLARAEARAEVVLGPPAPRRSGVGARLTDAPLTRTAVRRATAAGTKAARNGARVLADPLRAGLVGSVLLGIGALGVGTLPKRDPFTPPTGVYLLRASLVGHVVLTTLAIVGAALLLAAWLAVGRAVRAGNAPSAARMRAMIAAWSAPLVLAPPLFSRDLMSYAAQANLLRAGHDPYAVGPWVEPGPFADSVDPLWAATPSPYGPVFLWLGHQVSSVTDGSVFATVLGMRLLALLGVALLAVYLPRLADLCGVDGRFALWLGVLNPLTFMHFVAGGHNDALMIGLVVAGLCLALEGHPVLGSAAIALAAGVKAPAAFTLAFVGHIWATQLPGRHRLLRGLAGSGAVAFVTFAVLTAGTGLGYGWIQALGTPATVRTWLSPPTALGMLAGLAGRALDLGDRTYDFVDQFRFVSGGLALLIIAALSLRLPRGWSPVRGAAVALLLIVALGPVVQPWYLMWALVLVAAAGVRGRRELDVIVWGVVAVTVVSQLNGSIMRGLIAVPGTVLVLSLSWWVVTRHRAAADGREAPEGSAHAGTAPALLRALP